MTRGACLRCVLLVAVVAAVCGAPAVAEEPPITAQAVLGTAFTYQGRLTTASGLPLSGTYDFVFAAYDAAVAGNQWGVSYYADDVTVRDGLFTVAIDLGSGVFYGDERWLEVGVRAGTSTGAYTTLTPRTKLNAAPYALGLAPGAIVSRALADAATLTVLNDYPSLYGTYPQTRKAIQAWTTDGTALWGAAYDGVAVYGAHLHADGESAAIWGQTWSAANYAVAIEGDVMPTQPGSYSAAIRGANFGTGSWGIGVWGSQEGSGWGVYGTSVDGRGVYGFASSLGTGVYGQSSSGVGVAAFSNTGNLIEARSPGNLRFRVDNAGNVYADGDYYTGGADFAEMLPVAEEGLQPGDVLAIGPDGALVKAVGAYSSNVAGVYSTDPGVVGGYDGDGSGEVPLAVIGVVPAKASAENGAIAPGDLLTTSDTPGHVMKADPLTVDGVSFYPSGTIVGKSLEGLASGTGAISVLLILH